MILSANSNICVSLGLVSIDCVFLLIRGIFYCFFACLIIFLWDARHCDFFHVVYCVVFVFLQIFLRFVNWDQSIAQSGANYYPLLTHSPFWVISAMSWGWWGSPLWKEVSTWEQALSRAPRGCQAPFPLIRLGGSFLILQQFPYPHLLISPQLKTWQRLFADLWSSVFGHLPPLWYSLLWTLSALFTPDSQLYFFNFGSTWLLFPMLWPENFSKQ